MKKKFSMRVIALLLAMCTAAFLTGCSSSESEDTSETEAEGEENTTVYGRITAVGDGTIELALGEMEEAGDMDFGDMEDMEVPTDEDGETVDMSGDAAAESAEGDTSDGTDSDTSEETEAAGETSADSADTGDSSEEADSASDESFESGEAPEDAGEMPSGEMGDSDAFSGDMGSSAGSFTESGETLTLTITDDTAVTRVSGSAGGAMTQGGMGDADGEAPSGDVSGEAPSGEVSEDGEAPAEGSGSDGGDEAGAADADGSSDETEAADTGDSGDETEAADTDDSGDETDASGDGASDESFEGGEAPEDGESMEMPEGESFDASDIETEELTTDDLAVDDIVMVEYDSDGNAVSITLLSTGSTEMDSSAVGGMGGDMTGGISDADNGTAAETITEDGTYSDTTYTSENDDENALRIDGATVTLDSIIVQKLSGDSSDEDSGNFYGLNAALLALNGAQVTIEGAEITTSVSSGNGVFSYGEGTVVTISDSTIRTEGDNAGGIMTTGGGTTYAYDLDVETEGSSSAAIRTDRGGGTVSVDGGTYVTNGTGSPAVYSTADIAVSNAVLTANASEAVVVEGENTVTLTDCTVTGSMEGTYNDDSENIHNVMIYQSTSGDAEEGTASFSMTGGSLTSLAGDMFYVTNTACTIYLEDVELTLSDDILLCIEGNDGSRGWGSEGSNGGQVVFTAVNQALTGTITVDDISTLEMTLSGSSTFEGTINPDGEAGEVSVTLEDGCIWTLTGDVYITSFSGDLDDVVTNGYTLYIDGEAV